MHVYKSPSNKMTRYPCNTIPQYVLVHFHWLLSYNTAHHPLVETTGPEYLVKTMPHRVQAVMKVERKFIVFYIGASFLEGFLLALWEALKLKRPPSSLSTPALIEVA